MSGKELKESLIHSHIFNKLIINIALGMHKSLNFFCLFIAFESF